MTMRLATPWPGCQIRTGTMVATVSNNDAIRMWTPDEFSAKFGRAFDYSKDFCALMNADGGACGVHIDGCTWIAGGGMYATFDRIVTSDIRVIWMLFMAP